MNTYSSQGSGSSEDLARREAAQNMMAMLKVLEAEGETDFSFVMFLITVTVCSRYRYHTLRVADPVGSGPFSLDPDNFFLFNGAFSNFLANFFIFQREQKST